MKIVQFMRSIPLTSFMFSVPVHVFYPGSGPLQGSSHGNPPMIIILKRQEKGIQHAINKLGRFTSKVLTISRPLGSSISIDCSSLHSCISTKETIEQDKGSIIYRNTGQGIRLSGHSTHPLCHRCRTHPPSTPPLPVPQHPILYVPSCNTLCFASC